MPLFTELLGRQEKQVTLKMEEIRQSLNFQAAELSRVTAELSKLNALVIEVKSLREECIIKDKQISSLEKRVDELEQYTRKNNMVISGLKIKPRSYARAATSDPFPLGSEESVEKQVISFLSSKEIYIAESDIEACHPIPRRENEDDNTTKTPGPPNIIVRFVNRKKKIETLKQGKKLKGSDVYINDHLTKRNADIAKRARKLRYDKKIQATWISNCKVFIKTNGTPEEAKTELVSELANLDKYG